MKHIAGPLRSVIGAASTVTLAFGVGYLIDCRLGGGDVDKCWLTGGSLAGLGTAGSAAYKAGFWTPNPEIQQEQRNRTARTDTPKP
jgi:hypothetical protein